MKKNKLFVLILALIFLSTSVDAATSDDKKRECINFASGYININGSQEYRSCYRYNCQFGSYNRANMGGTVGYKCTNGNPRPYVKMISDGCKNYKGTCNNTNEYFCTTVEQIDCQRKADGTPFVTTTRRPIRQTTTTTRRTTKKSTKRRKTTTKNNNTTNQPGTTTTTSQTTTISTEPKKSSNCDLKRLVIFDTEIKVNNKKSNYTIKAPYDITTLDIIAEPADEKAKVQITGNENIPNEESKVAITITAEDGTTKIVTITVKRYNGENNDCTLANIFIEDYPLDFDKNTFDYTLKLPKSTKSLDLEVVPTDEINAKYEIKGNEKLGNNSKIEIVVVAQDGTKCNYTIKVKKQNNTWKYVLLIFLLTGALITSSYFLYKYLKKSKGRYKYE